MSSNSQIAPAPSDAAERDDMLAAIADAWPKSQTPPDLREACVRFVTEHRAHVDFLRAVTLVTFGVWLEDIERAGFDRRVLEQVLAAETQRHVAMLMRAACERDGRDYVPARQAIVAYMHAVGVAGATPFVCDIPAAVAQWRAEQEGAAA